MLRILRPFLDGAVAPDWWKEMCSQTNGNEAYGIQRAVWNGDWKYVLDMFDYDELYDLKNDPYKTRNVIDDPAHVGVVREICQKVWEFAKETGDGCTCPYITTSFAPYGPGVVNAPPESR